MTKIFHLIMKNCLSQCDAITHFANRLVLCDARAFEIKMNTSCNRLCKRHDFVSDSTREPSLYLYIGKSDGPLVKYGKIDEKLGCTT